MLEFDMQAVVLASGVLCFLAGGVLLCYGLLTLCRLQAKARTEEKQRGATPAALALLEAESPDAPDADPLTRKRFKPALLPSSAVVELGARIGGGAFGGTYRASRGGKGVALKRLDKGLQGDSAAVRIPSRFTAKMTAQVQTPRRARK